MQSKELINQISSFTINKILKDRKKVDNYSTLTINQRAISKYHMQDYEGALEDFNTVIKENGFSGTFITNNRLIKVDQWIEKIYSIIKKDKLEEVSEDQKYDRPLGTTPEEDYELTDKDRDEYMEEYGRASDLQSEKLTGFTKIETDLSKGNIVEKKNLEKNSNPKNHGKKWKKSDENILFKVADKEIKKFKYANLKGWKKDWDFTQNDLNDFDKFSKDMSSKLERTKVAIVSKVREKFITPYLIDNPTSEILKYSKYQTIKPKPKPAPTPKPAPKPAPKPILTSINNGMPINHGKGWSKDDEYYLVDLANLMIAKFKHNNRDKYYEIDDDDKKILIKFISDSAQKLARTKSSIEMKLNSLGYATWPMRDAEKNSSSDKDISKNSEKNKKIYPDKPAPMKVNKSRNDLPKNRKFILRKSLNDKLKNEITHLNFIGKNKYEIAKKLNIEFPLVENFLKEKSNKKEGFFKKIKRNIFG